MTNPYLQEIDEQFDKASILHFSEGEHLWVDKKEAAEWWLKVIAERDEALRKDFYKIDRYYTNPKGKVMVYVDDMSSLFSKE